MNRSSKKPRRQTSYHPCDANTSTMSTVSLPSHPGPSRVATHSMPSKRAIHHIMTSLAELLMDLVLSFIGYFSLVYVLYVLVETIAYVSFQDVSQIMTLIDRRNDIMRLVILSLWAARFVFRWRGHLACILRWLCPLSPEPYGSCPCCPPPMHGGLASGTDREDDEYAEQRGIGVFL